MNDLSKVVVAGHICLDIIPGLGQATELPTPGSLVHVGPAILSTEDRFPIPGLPWIVS